MHPAKHVIPGTTTGPAPFDVTTIHQNPAVASSEKNATEAKEALNLSESSLETSSKTALLTKRNTGPEVTETGKPDEKQTTNDTTSVVKDKKIDLKPAAKAETGKSENPAETEKPAEKNATEKA